jgi:hypothetical protein
LRIFDYRICPFHALAYGRFNDYESALSSEIFAWSPKLESPKAQRFSYAGAPRYYLFPINWAKQAVGSLVGEVGKRVNPLKK